MKTKVSQARSNWIDLKDAPAYKKRVRRSVHPRYEQDYATSTTSTHSDGVRVRSSLLIIVQSDAKNIEYLISWLQKTNLE